MENAQSHNKAEPSAPNSLYSIGSLPTRKATVTADVLCNLLEGERLTSIESVFSSSTTRLAAVVFYLEKKYGWQIDREDFAVGTNDGRISTVCRYFLKPEIIRQANIAGAQEFCAEVHAAREKQREKAAKRREEAFRINAAKQQRALNAGCAQ